MKIFVTRHEDFIAFTLCAMSIAPRQHRLGSTLGSVRWAALLVASMLLHLVIIGWISGNLAMPLWKNKPEPVMIAQLHQAPRVEPAAVTPPGTGQQPRKARRKSSPAPAAPAGAIQPEAAIPTGPPPDLSQMTEAFNALESAAPEYGSATLENAGPAKDPVTLEQKPAAEQSAGAPEKIATPSYKISIPPSAELKYNVEALRDGQMVYGSGKIRWQSDGMSYTVNGQASILFFTLLTFVSNGVIDDFGVAPLLYSEKRFRRPETNTHFHRERNTISFSASTVTYPRKGGEQDRASIVWQLTGIGRGDESRFAPGAEIELFVAGVRDGAPWRIRVIGEETVEIGGEKVHTWHVVRIPKQGSYDQKLDIWFSPQHEWYPVKLRYTDMNGEYLDMLLSNLTLATSD